MSGTAASDTGRRFLNNWSLEIQETVENLYNQEYDLYNWKHDLQYREQMMQRKRQRMQAKTDSESECTS